MEKVLLIVKYSERAEIVCFRQEIIGIVYDVWRQSERCEKYDLIRTLNFPAHLEQGKHYGNAHEVS